MKSSRKARDGEGGSSVLPGRAKTPATPTRLRVRKSEGIRRAAERCIESGEGEEGGDIQTNIRSVPFFFLGE